MGDRAIVVMRDGAHYTPGVYLHWAGRRVPELLALAAPRMRRGDADYSAARFCGVAHEAIPGNLSLGLVSPPTADDKANGFKDYSHGDAGVVVVDTGSGAVTCYAGYLAREPLAPLMLAPEMAP